MADTTIFTDAFAGAASTLITAHDANWQPINVVANNTLSLDGAGAVSGFSGFPCDYRYNGGSGWTNDQFASVVLQNCALVNLGSYLGVQVRMSTDTDAASDYYSLHYEVEAGTGTLKTFLRKRVNGTDTVLDSRTTIAWANGDEMRLRVIGTTLDVVRNGTTVYSVTDSSLSAGRPGIGNSGGGTLRMANFQAGNSTAPDTTAPTLSGASATGGALSATGSVTSNEAGTLWWKMDGSATATDPGSGSESGAGWSSQSMLAASNSVNFGAQTAGTRYGHFFGVDAAGNRSSVANSSSTTVTGSSRHFRNNPGGALSGLGSGGPFFQNPLQ